MSGASIVIDCCRELEDVDNYSQHIFQHSSRIAEIPCKKAAALPEFVLA